MAAGISPVPIEKGGKLPYKGHYGRCLWRPRSLDLPSDEWLRENFFEDCSIAIACGKGSGGVECIDFDKKAELFEDWRTLVYDNVGADLLARCTMQRTMSGGVHVVYRCEDVWRSDDDWAGNEKLAERAPTGAELEESPGMKRVALIETRGHGGYFLCYPSQGYTLLQNDFLQLAEISPDERDSLLECARFLNAVEMPEPVGVVARKEPGRLTPGDDFTQRASWEQVLGPHGWHECGKAGEGRVAWTRPGKKKGISATTGNGPKDCLYVHTTNAHPLEPGTSYTKFAAFCFLNYNGVFSDAARQLGKDGYGEQNSQPPRDEGVDVSGMAREWKEEKDPLSKIKGEGGRGLKVVRFSKESFEPTKPEYLWFPYIPQAKPVLLDADGSTGKTSVALALCAMFTLGLRPFIEDRFEPTEILYLHKKEDTDGELATVFQACGGDFTKIAWHDSNALQFDKAGLTLVYEQIMDQGCKLVIVDAFFYFLQFLLRDSSDQFAVIRVMEKIHAIVQQTGATFIDIRHTGKSTMGKAASDLGLGTVQFRNSHRGQLVMRFHPDYEKHRGMVVVTDERGSLLTIKGEAFGCRRIENEVMFISPEQLGPNPFDGYEYTDAVSVRTCKRFLCAILKLGPVPIKHILSKGADKGYARATVYRAAKEMGITEEGKRQRDWILPERYVEPEDDTLGL